MGFLLALIVAIAPAPPSGNITLFLGDDSMTVNQECANVIITSGYDDVRDIHSKLSATPEYVKACFK